MGDESSSLFEQPRIVASFPTPRPFQDKAHELLRAGYRQKHRNQLICAPTGAGKTLLALRIIHEALLRNKSAAFVCDRTTLINQTSEVADSLGLAHGIIQADHWRKDRSNNFQIASVQTLARRKWPHFDVLVQDEAHSLYAATTEFAKDKSHNCAIIGLTATPFTKGLGNIYSNLIMAATMSELTNDGYLVPMRVFSCRRPDMAGAETSGGEWTDRAAEERELCIVGDVVTEWMKFAGGKKTICFGATIKHCEELCRQFNQAGILASLYTSRTNDDERAEILEAFSDLDGPLKVLISVEALAKGFDKPFVEVICDCRPLRKSFSTFIQMIGRGLRISPATGKTEALLLDFSGNILRFAEDFEHFYFNGVDGLDKAQRLDSTARKEQEQYDRACPKCHHIPFVRRCSACGFEKPTVALVEHLPGTMQEITIGKAKAAESPEHLWAQIISYTRVHGNPDTMNGRAAHLYKDIMGVYPPRHFDSSVPPVEVTRAVLGKIRSRQIAFSKATRKAS